MFKPFLLYSEAFSMRQRLEMPALDEILLHYEKGKEEIVPGPVSWRATQNHGRSNDKVFFNAVSLQNNVTQTLDIS